MKRVALPRHEYPKSPYVWLVAGFVLYCVLFQDASAGTLSVPGFFLLSAAPLALLLASKPGKNRQFAAALAGATWLFLIATRMQQPSAKAAWLGVFYVAVAGVWYCLRNEMNWKRAAVFVCAASMAVRVAYVLFTLSTVRQHDIGEIGYNFGHIGYIQYILESGFRIPALDVDPRSISQFYHPPLHHLLAAIWVKFQMIAGSTLASAMENVQALTLFYSGLCNIYAYRLFRALGLKDAGLLIAYAIFCFSPNMVILSGSINNDCLMTTMVLATMLNAVNWYKAPSPHRCALTGLSLGLAMASKLNGAIIGIALAALFLTALIRRHVSLRAMIPQLALFLLASVPIGFFYPVYNLVRYGMPLNYVLRLGADHSLYVGDYSVIQRLFTATRQQVENLYMILRGPDRDYNLFLALLKNGVFEEYTFAEATNQLARPVGWMLFGVHAVLVTLSVPSMVITAWRGLKDRASRPLALFMSIAYASIFGFFIKFCFDFPHVCTMNSRYIIALIPIGAAAIGLHSKWRRVYALLAVLFCLFSTAQFFLLDS